MVLTSPFYREVLQKLRYGVRSLILDYWEAKVVLEAESVS